MSRIQKKKEVKQPRSLRQRVKVKRGQETSPPVVENLRERNHLPLNPQLKLPPLPITTNPPPANTPLLKAEPPNQNLAEPGIKESQENDLLPMKGRNQGKRNHWMG